jgi:hypothetical protein
VSWLHLPQPSSAAPPSQQAPRSLPSIQLTSLCLLTLLLTSPQLRSSPHPHLALTSPSPRGRTNLALDTQPRRPRARPTASMTSQPRQPHARPIAATTMRSHCSLDNLGKSISRPAPSLPRPSLRHLPCLAPATPLPRGLSSGLSLRPLLAASPCGLSSRPLLAAFLRGLSPALPCLVPPHVASRSPSEIQNPCCSP